MTVHTYKKLEAHREAARQAKLQAILQEAKTYQLLISELRKANENGLDSCKLSMTLWQQAFKQRVAASLTLNELVIEQSCEVIQGTLSYKQAKKKLQEQVRT